MKVLSLFDGMACGMLAFIAAGIPVERYDAYEIDKYAIKTATHNFPKIKEHGDVFSADFTQYEGVDFLVGGSPCTYWSIAQTNNRETEASGIGWELFMQYVRALKDAKPKYFIYENNYSMSKAIRASIDKTFGFDAVHINSALVSAQNRNRLYWVGKRNADGTYSKVDVKQPEDRGILLRDILETGDAWRKKSLCCDAIYFKATSGTVPFRRSQSSQRMCVAEPIFIGEMPEHKGTYRNGNQASQQYRVYDTNGKGVAVTTCAITNVAEPVQVGALPRPNGELSTSQAFRVYDINGKSVNINAGGGGAGGKTGLYAIPVEFEDGIPTKAISCSDGKTYTVYEVKDGQITIKGKQYPIKLADGYYIIRKLTVRECMRLQTVPEWYEFPVSDSQAYKMLGNGWTVEVISHLINSALSDKTVECVITEQMNIFDLL